MIKWNTRALGVNLGYSGPHCMVFSLYVAWLKMKVDNAAHVIPQLHAAVIIIRILHFVMRVSGRVMERYLCILMYIKVWIDVMKHTVLKKLFKKHNSVPSIQSLAINVVSENGAINTPTKKSATAKLTRNILVRVLIPLCRQTTAMTIKLPNIANTMEIDNHEENTTV